jgi:Tol biopolymer transport system component
VCVVSSLLACVALPLGACTRSPGDLPTLALAWRSVPIEEQVGVPFSPLVVEVRNERGGIEASDSGRVVTLSFVAGATTVVATATTSRGLAVFDALRHGVPETVTLRAESPGIPALTSAPFRVVPGPSTGLAISMASVPTAGGQANGSSDYMSGTIYMNVGPLSLSADGRYVAFHTLASNLVAGDLNGMRDVYVRDRVRGATERASLDAASVEFGSDCHTPSMSADGRLIAFACGYTTAFVRDRQTGATEPACVFGGAAISCAAPALSGSGRYVTFATNGANLRSAPTDTFQPFNRIAVRDRVTGATVCADVSSTGADANAAGVASALSRDGRFVAFASNASNLVPDDTNGMLDFFVHDRDADGNGVFDEAGKTATERVSIGPAGEQLSIAAADSVGVSDDGQFVVFSSGAQIMLRDRTAGTTTLVTKGLDGSPFVLPSWGPAISGDGRFVVFASPGLNVAPSPVAGNDHVLVWERTSGSTVLVSVDATGLVENASVSRFVGPSISADGRYIAFVSAATNLVPGDANGVADVFVAPNPLYP